MRRRSMRFCVRSGSVPRRGGKGKRSAGKCAGVPTISILSDSGNLATATEAFARESRKNVPPRCGIDCCAFRAVVETTPTKRLPRRRARWPSRRRPQACRRQDGRLRGEHRHGRDPREELNFSDVLDPTWDRPLPHTLRRTWRHSSSSRVYPCRSEGNAPQLTSLRARNTLFLQTRVPASQRRRNRQVAPRRDASDPPVLHRAAPATRG